METLEQRQATMRKVIRHMIDGKPYADLTFEERRIAKECLDKGYIEGVELVEMITGRVVMEYRFPPRLTEPGVAFLSGDKPLQKADNADTDAHQDRTLYEERNNEKLPRWTKADVIATVIGTIIAFTVFVFDILKHFGII